eukprot:SAG31_NODE_1070_length_10071_cov_6.989771_5_plen_70_part_00
MHAGAELDLPSSVWPFMRDFLAKALVEDPSRRQSQPDKKTEICHNDTLAAGRCVIRIGHSGTVNVHGLS